MWGEKSDHRVEGMALSGAGREISKSVSMFLLGGITSVFAQWGNTVHVVAAQEAAR